MPVQPSPLINIMAELLAEEIKKWWPDCNAEKMLWAVDDYESLAKQFKYATGIETFPTDPKEGQVIYVDYGEYTYRYWFRDGHWRYVEARSKELF